MTPLGYTADGLKRGAFGIKLPEDEGLPCGVKFHLIAMALLAVAQNHEERLQALEAA